MCDIGENMELKNLKTKAFTLAEVLVTLGIIGVVAALTLPILMTNYQKRNTEAHLKHFYSLMRQGIEMTANDPEADCEIKQDYIKTPDGYHTWWDKCLGRELKTSDKSRAGLMYNMIVLADGSAFVGYVAGTDTVHFMYCTSPDKCGAERYDGRTSFLFTLVYTANLGMQFYTGQGAYTGVSREQLLTDCRSGLKNEEDAGINMTSKRHACAALIQRDGWRIAPDYPWQYTAREKK